LRLFNALYAECGFQPILVFDGAGRFITAVASCQTAERQGNRAHPAPAVGRHPHELAARRQSLLLPRVSRLLSRQRARLPPRRAPTTTLRRHLGDLEASVKARYEAAKDGKARRYKEFYDVAASWSRIARQGKLVKVFDGRVLDVAVDLRWGCPNFGGTCRLSWALRTTFNSGCRFGHGHVVLSETADFSTNVTTSTVLRTSWLCDGMIRYWGLSGMSKNLAFRLGTPLGECWQRPITCRFTGVDQCAFS
jgi:dTDP-4-dehydrorhamnose 3,5-epimerase